MTARADAPSTRERVGWAVLFGVPMGVGVAVATAQSIRASATHPLVLAAGVTTTVLLVALVLGATAVNQSGDRPADRN